MKRKQLMLSKIDRQIQQNILKINTEIKTRNMKYLQ